MQQFTDEEGTDEQKTRRIPAAYGTRRSEFASSNKQQREDSTGTTGPGAKKSERPGGEALFPSGGSRASLFGGPFQSEAQRRRKKKGAGCVLRVVSAARPIFSKLAGRTESETVRERSTSETAGRRDLPVDRNAIRAAERGGRQSRQRWNEERSANR